MNLGKQVTVDDRFQLAVVDRENNVGAILFRIVAWLEVEGAVVPFVVDPSKETYRLVAATEYGDDVVGIVQPDLDNSRWWDDQANAILGAEEVDNERRAKSRAHCGRDPSVVGACGGTSDSCSCECNSCLPPVTVDEDEEEPSL